MNSPFSQEPEEESLDPNSSATNSSATSSSTPTAKRSSRHTFVAGTWIPRPSSATSEPSPETTLTDTLDSWMSSLAASRASHLASQESGSEKTIRETCGPRRRPYFAWFDPISSSLRTCLGYLLSPISDEYLGPWPRSGSMRSGRCWARTTLGRRTAGTAYGSSPFPTPAAQCLNAWPTPKASDGDKVSLGHRGAADTLTSAVRLFPTPDHGMATRGVSNSVVRKGEGRRAGQPRTDRTVNLGDAVAYWPTPTICGNHNRKGASPTSGDGLATAVTRASYPTPAARDWRDDGMAPSASDRKSPCLPAVVAQKGSLNPDWVETLMGWPIGWSGPLPQESGPASEASTDGSLLVFFLEEVVSSTAGRGSKPSVTDRSRSASSLRGENSSLERPKTEEKETK